MNFEGGWSYTNKEMGELFKNIDFSKKYEDYKILEFGGGDSSIKIWNYFNDNILPGQLTYCCFESDEKFVPKHDKITTFMYDEKNIEVLDINSFLNNQKFDLIFIDGPNGVKRKLWYYKLRNHVKEGTIILIDDFNHYGEFGEELDLNFEYDLLSFSDEKFVPYGEHSWKIVKIKKIRDEQIKSISVVLNTYKRLEHLDEQIQSIINQTVRPIQIIIWNNSEKYLENISKYEIPIIVFNSTKNMGVWSRFFASFNCKGEYIAFFDDDTIPGNKWFENCLNCMKEKEGLYGTTGYRFGSSYFHFERIGWLAGCDNIEEVDIIGHAWFLKKKWMTYYVNDLPPIDEYLLMGEDIHLSYTFFKYGNIKTYVARQPLNEKDLLGSTKGLEYGGATLTGTNVAISHQDGATERFNKVYNHWVKELGHKLYYRL